MTLRTTVLDGERERYSSEFVLRGESLVIRQGCNVVSKLETRSVLMKEHTLQAQRSAENKLQFSRRAHLRLLS